MKRITLRIITVLAWCWVWSPAQAQYAMKELSATQTQSVIPFSGASYRAQELYCKQVHLLVDGQRWGGQHLPLDRLIEVAIEAPQGFYSTDFEQYPPLIEVALTNTGTKTDLGTIEDHPRVQVFRLDTGSTYISFKVGLNPKLNKVGLYTIEINLKDRLAPQNPNRFIIITIPFEATELGAPVYTLPSYTTVHEKDAGLVSWESYGGVIPNTPAPPNSYRSWRNLPNSRTIIFEGWEGVSEQEFDAGTIEVEVFACVWGKECTQATSTYLGAAILEKQPPEKGKDVPRWVLQLRYSRNREDVYHTYTRIRWRSQDGLKGVEIILKPSLDYDNR